MNPQESSIKRIEPSTYDSTEQLRHKVLDAVGKLRAEIRHVVDVPERIEWIQRLLESLPLSTSEFGLAMARLENAERYLISNERGAAMFELKLLEGNLQSTRTYSRRS